MLLRRLTLSHADEPRKPYEGYDANDEKDDEGVDRGSADSDASGFRERPERPSTVGGAAGDSQERFGQLPRRERDLAVTRSKQRTKKMTGWVHQPGPP